MVADDIHRPELGNNRVGHLFQRIRRFSSRRDDIAVLGRQDFRAGRNLMREEGDAPEFRVFARAFEDVLSFGPRRKKLG